MDRLRQLLPSAPIAGALFLVSSLSVTAHAAPEVRGVPAPLVVAAGERSAGLLDGPGAPVGVDPVLHWDAARVFEHLEGFGLDSPRARYGVDAYRVEYRTVGPDGSPTTASSLVALPRMEGDQKRVKQVVWLHGPMVYKDDAPSVYEDSDDRAVAFAFAAAGFLTTVPDYLGLGLGPGTHPYNDRATEVSASIDALRATAVLAAWLGQRVDPSVAVSGFSQGGAASLALARALQERVDPRLRLGALAAIAGPYNTSATLAAALAGKLDNPGPYLAHLTVAWNRLHRLYDSPEQAFLAPYDRLAEQLFDGEHTPEEVLNFLPERPSELFTPHFLAQLAQPSGRLRAALATTDAVCDFQPAVTTHLYAASGDVANSELCRIALERRGASVELHDLGEVIDQTDNLAVAVVQVVEQLSID